MPGLLAPHCLQPKHLLRHKPYKISSPGLVLLCQCGISVANPGPYHRGHGYLQRWIAAGTLTCGSLARMCLRFRWTGPGASRRHSCVCRNNGSYSMDVSHSQHHGALLCVPWPAQRTSPQPWRTPDKAHVKVPRSKVCYCTDLIVWQLGCEQLVPSCRQVVA